MPQPTPIDLEDGQARPGVGSRAPPAVAQARKGVILVVDDEARNRSLLRAYLSANYTVVEAENGRIALEVLAQRPCDLILLDVMMPEQDGFETCRLIKARHTDGFLPVILITALDEQDDRNTGLEAGADDFLSKPVDRRELALRVSSFLRLREQERVIRTQVVELQRLQALKDDLVSLLVHDLRNPLAGLLSSLELAADAPASKEQAEDLQRAMKSAAGLREVLDETLQVRLLEENAIVARRLPVNLDQLLRTAAATLEGTARRRRVTVACSVEGAPSAALDDKLVRRSVENLLSNALKYTPSGSDVSIVARNEGGRVDIEVGDRGGGVPDDLKRTMFEKFGSLEAKRGAARRGIGLGLYLVKLVALAHGGEVSVHDRPGGGALFRLRLLGEAAPAASASGRVAS